MIDIHIRFWRPAFHGRRDNDEADWPPSPTRLIGALLAGAYALPDDDPQRVTAVDTLQYLTEQEPPTITAPKHVELTLPDTYTESTWKPVRLTGIMAAKWLDFSHLGFNSISRVQKSQGGIALADTLLSYRIDASLDEEALLALGAAAARVPYFGTSKDPADIAVEPATGPLGPFESSIHRRWYAEPRANGESRGWQPNTIEWFNHNYERVFGVDPAISKLAPIAANAYTRPLHYTAVGPEGTDEFPIFSLTRSAPHHTIGEHLGALNAALRTAGHPWTAIPLTVSNFVHADGRLVGVGLLPQPAVGTVRAGEEPNETVLLIVQRSLDAIERNGAARYPRLTRAVISPKALQAVTWIGPSMSWYSATPLRVFPDERVVRFQLEQELSERYGAVLDQLRITREPGASISRKWTDGPYTDGLGQWWVSFTLATPLEGPLLLGSRNDHGFGLLHPGALE